MIRAFAYAVLAALLAWGGRATWQAERQGPAGQPTTPPDSAMLSFCFAPDTDEAYIQSLYQRLGQTPGLSPFQFNDGSRWQATVNSPAPLFQGDPTVITWSLIADGVSIAGFNGEPTSDSNLFAFLNGIYPGGQAEWLPLFEAIFERWSEISGLRYVYEPNDDGAPLQNGNRPPGVAGVRGDIRIGGHFIDGNSNVLAYNFFPGAGGEMVIDTGDAFYNNTGNNSLGLRNVLTHEHGHGLGFSHVCPIQQTKLMEPFVTFAFDGPQLDDKLAVQRGYGDTLEHNDTPGEATPTGSLDENGFAIVDVSIDGLTDVDYYAFTVDVQGEIEVNLTPIGEVYSSGPQLGQSCPAGPNIDTLNFNDIGFDIVDSDGVTTLITVNDNGSGLAEELLDFELLPGDYYIRVFPGPTDQVQLYEIDAAYLRITKACEFFDVLTSWQSANPSCLGRDLDIRPIVSAITDGTIVSP